MPDAIVNGEVGLSVRNKINTAFTELATAQSDITALEGDVSGLQAAVTAAEGDIAGLQAAVTALDGEVAGKQDALVSGTNVKTINGESIVGSGNIAVTGGASALDGLTDVVITTPATGQVLKFDGTNWVNDTDETGGSGVTDGDKGDITVSASGATWTVDAAAITLAKMADLAQDQFIGRTTASTGVPQTATITAAARTVLDDTTVAAMVNTLGGATSTGTGGLARAASPTFTGVPAAPTAAVATNTTQIATTAFVRGEISNISGTITTAKTSFANADKALALDSASSDAPVTITGAVIRTVPVGTSLGTTGSVALDFATLVGTRQRITLTGNITFTTSNLAAGRGLELRIGAGGSTRTLTWPAWVAFGAALPTSLASGATLIVSLFANSTTDASVDAVAVVSA